MRYRKPFTIEQRREAVRRYKSYRRNYRVLRDVYTPANDDERRILRDYRRRVQALGAELLNPDADVRVDELNRLDVTATDACFQYMRRKLFRS